MPILLAAVVETATETGNPSLPQQLLYNVTHVGNQSLRQRKAVASALFVKLLKQLPPPLQMSADAGEFRIHPLKFAGRCLLLPLLLVLNQHYFFWNLANSM